MTRVIPKPPHPLTPVVGASGEFERVWFGFLSESADALRHRMPITGTATFAAGTTVDVTFDTAEPNANYRVLIEPTENKTFWVSNKATTGFRLNASASSSATLGWVLVRD